MSLTDHGENLVLNLLSPSLKFIGLNTVTPTESSVGIEVYGGGYKRMPTTWTAPNGGMISNPALVQFPTATADWGTITSWGIWDAETGGNQIWYGILSRVDTSSGELIAAPKTVTTNDIFEFPAGDIKLYAD